ncbi:MAG: radical SAM protein, partial [Mariprofundaceae bacterium]|nr:radical SAM protein [Mariprofundaceae bacterium]
MSKTLSIHNHDRDFSKMTYVYPVVSRRAGGVSIGINLNPNNACCWQCIYCQVPDLKRGSAPHIDLKKLKTELDQMLYAVTSGDFMHEHVPEGSRQLKDIAISGNGEPSSCQDINQVLDIMLDRLQSFQLKLPIVFISNGSFMHRPYMHQALDKIQQHGGEVWFKIDRATPESLKQVNGVELHKDYLKRQIQFSSQHAKTWVQSCFFALDDQAPSQH